jgi:beta-glucosidase
MLNEHKAWSPESQKDDFAQEWWGPRHQAKTEEAENRTVDLLFVGDSITHGFEDPKGGRVWKEFYGDRNVFNIGFGGDRTEQVLWRLQNGEIDGLDPKLTVLLIGTNNTGHRQDPAEVTAKGIRLILDELQERLPSSKILLLAIFPRGEKPSDPLRVLNSEINEIIQDFADDKRIFFRDIGPHFVNEDGSLPADTFPDFLHPEEAGYRLWAEAIEPDVETLMA